MLWWIAAGVIVYVAILVLIYCVNASGAEGHE